MRLSTSLFSTPIIGLKNRELDQDLIRVHVRYDQVIVGAAFLIAVWGYVFCEKIPIGDGFGWDGTVYGSLARDGLAELQMTPLNRYTVQRVLPSAIVHLMLRIIGCEMSNENVIRAFGLLNILCITSVAWCWVQISHLLSVSLSGRWLGFCALILNFAVVKHTSYYPVLTDIPAYAIGCGMLYCYLTDRPRILALLTAAGAFVWPLLMLQGSLLILFPRNQPSRGSIETIEVSPRPTRISYWIAGFAAYYYSLAAIWSVTHANLPICGYINPARTVFPLSLLISAGYVFFVVLRMIDVREIAAAAIDLVRRHPFRLVGVLMLIVAVQVAYAIAAPLPGSSNGPLYLLRLLIKSVVKPGAYFIGHAVYFGPIIPLALLLGDRVCSLIRRCGVGVTIAAALGIVQALDGESRHLLHAFPLLVPFVVLAAERLQWGKKELVWFAAISLLATKFWLTINDDRMEQAADLLSFPLQSYGMNYGVFMTNETYLIQGTVLLGVTWYLAQMAWPNRPAAVVAD